MKEYQFLERRDAAEYLTSLGFRTAPATLAKLACIGGGPVLRHFGRRVVYEKDALLIWAQAKLSAPVRSTSELLHGVAQGVQHHDR